ncbi:PAS domain S-box protein [Novosphingobium album (ex Liu et al. 2023)]|uniref:histidine kinase n=1 Tax=Novosphingobium album (ex Liu et al. 2023) TaxID=3031130 RepID=A0ABT5WTU7_9SPHN|nr:PAS domain S-box protein [Novosphingobium album (ex Liu et al. 2023)]MDE8653308.1 PAS domain S-box protein [Novosphingobium album (ex Liu et al. 2023)]
MSQSGAAADPAALLAAIVASTDDAIVGKELDGRILSWNDAAARIFGYSAQEMIGRNVRILIPAGRQAEEDEIIACITRGERVPTFETVRLRKDGSEVAVAVTVSPVLDAQGRVVAASKIARDITAQKRVEARLRDSEARFRLLADNIAQLAWIADGKGWVVWYNKRWFDYTGTTLEAMQGWGWKAVHHPDHVDRVVAKLQHSWDTGEDWEDSFPLRGADGNYRWFLSRAVPIRDEAGEILWWFGTNTDVTAMREAEQRIELLLQEVNHRSKNLLAIVQSLARRGDADNADFVERLEQRIQALAANQDVLVSRAWASVPVGEMIRAQLRFTGEGSQQVTLDGPDVLLSPGSAEALAMAIHEMATNAMKYGALSVPTGRVEIAWNITDDDRGDGAGARFHIAWRETGGPVVTEPTRKGFGSRIIVDVPRVKLTAQVTVAYPPEGFRWTLSCAIGGIS